DFGMNAGRNGPARCLPDPSNCTASATQRKSRRERTASTGIDARSLPTEVDSELRWIARRFRPGNDSGGLPRKAGRAFRGLADREDAKGAKGRSNPKDGGADQGRHQAHG